MKTTLLQRSFLACVLLTSLTAAQGRPGRQGKEPTGDPRGAMAARPEGMGQLEFVATGLTAANADQVARALDELTFDAHACKACGVEQIAEGACPKCQGLLEAHPVKLFAAAKVNEAKVRLAFAPGAPVRYSQIEKALKTQGASIDPKLFPLTGRIVLHLRGGEADVASVQKALEETALFPEAHVAFDPESGELRCPVRCGDGLTMAALQAAVGKSTATFADVSWGGKPGKGGKAGQKRAGGKGPGKGAVRGKKVGGGDD